MPWIRKRFLFLDLDCQVVINITKGIIVKKIRNPQITLDNPGIMWWRNQNGTSNVMPLMRQLDVFIRQLLNKCVKFLKEHGHLFSGMKKWIRVGQLMARVKAGGKASENFPVTSPS
jgi:hypothetical protein